MKHKKYSSYLCASKTYSRHWKSLHINVITHILIKPMINTHHFCFISCFLFISERNVKKWVKIKMFSHLSTRYCLLRVNCVPIMRRYNSLYSYHASLDNKINVKKYRIKKILLCLIWLPSEARNFFSFHNISCVCLYFFTRWMWVRVKKKLEWGIDKYSRLSCEINMLHANFYACLLCLLKFFYLSMENVVSVCERMKKK
jgi:hypothetical protein